MTGGGTALDGGERWVVAREERRVDDNPGDHRRHAQPDDRLVHARFPAAPGLPAVVHLALVAEGVRLEHRLRRPDEVLPLGEGLVVGPHHRTAEPADGHVRELFPGHDQTLAPSPPAPRADLRPGSAWW